MKTLTYSSIKALGPCYDPIKYIPEDWQGTTLDLLQMKNIPGKDRIWVVVRKEFMSETELKQFGLACARFVEKYSKDPRVKACNDATELYLQGKITKEELLTARRVAYAADAAVYAADAAYAAAAYAAAAYAAAYAADAAVYAADAAYAAYAADAAAYAAAYAAHEQIREEQCSLLIGILS